MSKCMYCEVEVSELINDMCKECYAFEQRLDKAVFTEAELKRRFGIEEKQRKQTLDGYL